ncbi:MAG: TIGR04076 family protein [Candidatus Thorarchaeota archaeon]|nr:TIGR04076 family protein [Candidatus Thorarchaeota archaeon]
MKLSKMKIAVVRKFSPEEVFGHELLQSSDGTPIPTCSFFEKGQEFITENSFTRPEGFCGWAWRDLTVRLTKFDLIDDMDWPEKDMTYVACGDGVRPVVFRLERLAEQ